MKGRLLFQLMLVSIAAIISPLLLCPAQQAKQVSSEKSAKPQRVKAIRFRPFTSPQGRFKVHIPADWEFESFAPDESSVGFVPKGKRHPEISIAFTEASMLAYQMGLQPFGHEWYSSRLSAKDFLQQVFIPLLRQKVPDLKAEPIASKQFSAAEVVVTGSSEGKKLQGKIACAMDHLEDPTIPPAGGWYNFAYLNFIVAPPQEMAAVQPIAAEIFRSFRPNERWMGEVMQAIVEGMQTRRAIIAKTVKRLNAMEMQQRMSEMQSTTKFGQGLADALGGMTEVKNKDTGDIWRVSDTSKYYFEEGGTVYGTDDPSELNRVGRHPLER